MTARLQGLALLLIALLASHPAWAGLTQQEIGRATAHPQIGAQLPLDRAFATRGGERMTLRQAMAGRPSLLVFADLTCTTLCGVTLSSIAGVLGQTSLDPGRDFSLVVASIDPKDSAADADHMAAAQLGDGALASDAVFLIGAGTDRLAEAAGFGYAYDAENDAYAHPVGLFVLSPGGTIARYLPGLGLDGKTMADALDEAAAERPTPIASSLLLLCYHFDPVTGRYTPTITAIMTAAGTATALFVALGVGLLVLRDRRSRREG